jgi:hypothetical protein
MKVLVLGATGGTEQSAEIGRLVDQAVTPFRGSALVIRGRTNV